MSSTQYKTERHLVQHQNSPPVLSYEDGAEYTNDPIMEKSVHRHQILLDDTTGAPTLSSDIQKEKQDEETGVSSSTSNDISQQPEEHPKEGIAKHLSKWKVFTQIFIWLLFTAWWIAGLILHRYDYGWLIPFLLYLCVTLRILFNFVPVSYVMRPARWVYNNTAIRIYNVIPKRFRTWLAALVTVAVICIGSFVPEESVDNTRANRAISILGLFVILLVLWATSRDRKRIPWHTVIGGMLTQFLIALFVLKSQVGYDIFNFISSLAGSFLGFADQGTAFLTAPSVVDLHYFITGVVPPIIFFIAVVQCLYYVGVLQWLIVKFATFFFWILRVSGAEAVVAAASPFLGQGESAMLIRPFIPHLTNAEIHQVMCSGFATIAGSVLVAYISLGLNAQALVSSCIMSIPASLTVSKMRYPETEETVTSGRVHIPKDESESSTNILHAFSNGAWLGIKIAGTIVAVLLAIISMIGLVNGLLGWWGKYLNITDNGEPYLTLQLIMGYICYPIAFLLGVPREDLLPVAQLIGTKIIANEFVAFTALTKDPRNLAMSPRSQIIATYALCGFGNFGSLGVQIGVLSQLAPGRAGDVSRVALSALFSGVLSTLTSASIAGMLITSQHNAS